MNYDINRLYADGDPDYFDIMDKGSFVGSCDYDSDNAVPFIIANGELHIGDYGIGHVDMGCNYETDEFSKSSDFAPGRLWLEINQRKKSADFPYSIISFWWGSEEHIVDSHLVDELLAKFHLDRELVLVASFEEEDYGKVYPYKEWSFKVSKANDSQKEVLATHLMNAKNKHNATSDFRATRDRNIGKKLTNDKGQEMPVAQYRNMIYSENVKRIIRNVIKEYINKGNKKMIIETWTNNNAELKNHLKNIAHMDDKTLKTLANVFPTYYLDYLIRVNPGTEDEDYYYDLVNVADNHSEYSMSYYIEKLNLPIDKRFGYYVKNTINKFPRRYYDDSRINYRYTEIPDNVTLNYKKPFINKVLVHKCSNDGDAENILLNGFKYGQDLGNLAWSCGVKNNGNYGFAYEFNDYAENCNNYPNYGAEGVVFIGSGVMVTHHGDRRNKYDKSPNECIFDINSVSSFVCRFRVSHGYCEIYNANNKLVLKKENYTIPKALEWISNNLIRY